MPQIALIWDDALRKNGSFWGTLRSRFDLGRS